MMTPRLAKVTPEPEAPALAPEPVTEAPPVEPIAYQPPPAEPAPAPKRTFPEPDLETTRTAANDSADREYLVAQAAREDEDVLRWLESQAPAQPATPEAPTPASPMPTNPMAVAGDQNPLIGGVFALPRVLSAAEPVGRDILGGLTTDAANVWIGGPLKALAAQLNLIDEAATWLNRNVADLRLGTLAGEEMGEPKAGEAPIVSGKNIPNLGGAMDKPKTVTGNIMQAATQFITGFAMGGRMMGMTGATTAAGNLGQTMVRGAYADFAAFEGSDANLAHLVEMVPALRNPVTEYLAHDGDDTALEGRIKNTMAGAVPNVLVEGVLAGLRGIKAARKTKALVKSPGDTPDDVARKIAHRLKEDPEVPVGFTADNTAQKVKDIIGDPAKPEIEIERVAPIRGVMDDAQANSTLLDRTGLPDQEVARQTVGHADQAAKPKPPPVPGTPERPYTTEVYFNWSKIETSTDVEDYMRQMIDADVKAMDDAGRGVRSNKMTKMAADQEDVWRLIKDERKANAAKILTAEETYALRRLQVSAGEKLMDVARAAQSGGPAEMFAFRRMLATYDVIQKHVKGIRTEQARALQQWNMQAASSRELLDNIDTALLVHGGLDAQQELAKRIVSAGEEGGTKALMEMAEKGVRAKTAAAIKEIWINSILSGPKTQLVNIMGNTATFSQALAERAAAGKLGGLIDPVDGIKAGEATAMMFGTRQALRDMFRMGSKAQKALARAWQTGQSGMGMGKAEQLHTRAISAEFMGVKSNTALGRGLDLAGNLFAIPTRALGAADEFFKLINYRAELWAQAYRTASEEIERGLLVPAKMKDRMMDIIMDPPENIHKAAQDFATYNTFTNDPGPFTRQVSKLRSVVDQKSTSAVGIPSGSFLLPFINTPANIFSYTFERTPIALIMGRYKAAIAAGGAQANLARAKLGLGWMMVAVAYDMALDGHITGSGPSGDKGWRQRSTQRRLGWQPYSVRVQTGTTEDGTPEYRYFAYNRLDPVGSIVGLAADIGEYMRNHETGVDIQAEEAFAAAVFGAADNLTSKAYLSGFADFVEAMHSPDRRGEQWFTRLAGSFVPTGVKEWATIMDPRIKSATDIDSSIRSRLPWLSEGVPGRTDFWGQDLEYTSGLGQTYDAISPIYSKSNAKASRIDREFMKLNYHPAHPGSIYMDGRQVTLRNMPEARNQYAKLTSATPASKLIRDNLQTLSTVRGGRSIIRKLARYGDRNLKDALTDMVEGRGPNAAEYEAASEEDKRELLSDMISLYRRAAKEQLLREFPRIGQLRESIPERSSLGVDADF